MVNSAVAEEAFTKENDYAEAAEWTSATKPSMYHPAWRYPEGEIVPIEQGYEPRLWASEWYKLFKDIPGDGRKTLTWRNVFEEVRNKNTFIYYTPTDQAFRPFNYTLDNIVNSENYPDNRTDWPGIEDVLQNWSCFNDSKIGTYSWTIQELFKGRFTKLTDKDSDTGGWGLNKNYNDCEEPADPNAIPNCTWRKPIDANILNSELLKIQPFFSKNPDYQELYSYDPVSVSDPIREELLANELPALTFAAGHKGIEAISDDFPKNETDIRQKFLLDNKDPWPRGTKQYEWRHSDIYVVAYPYLSGLYDEWVTKIEEGVSP